MSAALKVVQPGLCTTVQDKGRFGYQALGVPVAGALDPVALEIANALVGNPGGTAALEILVQGPEFEVEAESVRIALAGTESPIEILGDGGGKVPPWQSATLARGQRFRIGMLAGPADAVLAVAGGFDIAPVLGSLSTYVRGRIGGIDGRPLVAGDALPLRNEAAPARGELMLGKPPRFDLARPVRVVLGPQAEYFTDAAIETFLGRPFTISREADRMGMRLEGPEIAHRETFNIVSDGIAAGAVQVPGSRQPIVMLADRGATGGYPKIATVISTDLPLVGGRRPGQSIRFAAVTVEEAEAIARARAAETRRLIDALEPARPTARLDLDSLYAGNLISGVINADE